MSPIVAASRVSAIRSGPKIEFAERALSAARERTITPAAALSRAGLDQFELGGNSFQVFCPDAHARTGLAPLAISHLGSAFTGQSIALYINKHYPLTYVSLKAAPQGTTHSPSLFKSSQTTTELFLLSFCCAGELMELTQLSSRILGKGGQALLGLYNLAAEIGIKKIEFNVREGNLKAKLFYANLGFGLPTNLKRTSWVVTLSPSPALVARQPGSPD